MKIDVVKLKENIVENFQESLLAPELDLDTSEIRYKGSINISTEAKKELGVVSTKTHVSAAAELVCSRCLKQFDSVVEKNFDIQYPLDKSQQLIDITKDIREEVILGYPVKFLCKSDCLGLCPKCGQNLNEKKCECKTDQ
ncbi:MAG: DUF177 domain-containing protein [Candidatus Omnitrophota bacterium]